jgi:Zn-dependent protease with chaperone function
MRLLPGPGKRPSLKRRLAEQERPPLAYALGLAGVALAMFLLPAAYAAICLGSVWLLRWHAARHLGWLLGPASAFLPGVAYVVSLVILAGFILFLLRPFAWGRRRVKPDFVLKPEQEPRLYAFVQQICGALGSPVPVRIQVSMDVNACARLAPGWGNFRDGGLELVLGLPLVRGLELGQFAGVLAHELGHFRQGAAMRLVHGIRSVNHWFARAAGREEAWERDLAASAERMDPFLYGLCWCARVCAFAVRWTLQAHARAGQAVSCLLLREMELQADRDAVRLVGGETFASMVLEAKVIEAAWGLANRSLGLALREGNLADDLPGLVAAHTRVFIPEVRRRMERSLMSERTAWFDTHPSLGDRVRRARRAASRGQFHANGPAHGLFAEFGSLSRMATLAFYRSDLGEEFNSSRVMATGDLVTGQSEVQVGEAAVAGYFLGMLTNLRPLWPGAGDLADPDGRPSAVAAPDPAAVRGEGARTVLVPEECARLRARLEAARRRVEEAYPEANGLGLSFAAADARMLDAVQALALMRANFWIEPGDFQLRKGGATQAGAAFREAEAEQRALAMGLLGFEEAMRQRMAAALRLLDDPGVRAILLDAGVCSREAARLLPVLAALEGVQPRLESLRRSFHGMGILLENMDGNESAPEVEAQLKTHALAIRIDLEAVDRGLRGREYPFGSQASVADLAEYALDRMPADRDYAGHLAASEEVLGRCYALYFRIMGRLALAAGRVEGVLGLGPLRIGD